MPFAHEAGRQMVPTPCCWQTSSTHCPAPSHTPAAHAIPAAAGSCRQVDARQVSCVQGWPSSHWASRLQQPAIGVKTQRPAASSQVFWLQSGPASQAPQTPPQPSGPHCLPLHCGVHRHVPSTQVSVPLQVPQEPWQPSSPQGSVAAHCGTQGPGGGGEGGGGDGGGGGGGGDTGGGGGGGDVVT